MKIEEAYSTDYNDVVDAEKAYDLFWSGEIRDKRNFECPDQNCDARITCANLDKARDKMKNILHFKSYGVHSSECNVVSDKSKVNRPQDDADPSVPRNSYVDSETDVLLLRRLKQHSSIVSTHSGISVVDPKDIKKKMKQSYFMLRNSKRDPEYSTIKPLVSKFEDYLLEGTLSTHHIKISDYKVSYKDMFVEVNGQEFNALSEYPRIYYGEATIIKARNNDYRIRFIDQINHEGKCFNPEVYVHESVLNKHYMRRYWKNLLNEILSLKGRARFFVYCKPNFNENTKNNITTTYLNFRINSLDYLEFRHLL
ncbi:hypothetical protein [Paenibacillus kobensis]|uniref:hypothetical protein n=1 Tax=Paenibacillus kobensis TaxID=59841 RepID=UPI000FDAC0C6|nr:hypothetical protein [Paenibacillus kobensis]